MNVQHDEEKYEQFDVEPSQKVVILKQSGNSLCPAFCGTCTGIGCGVCGTCITVVCCLAICLFCLLALILAIGIIFSPFIPDVIQTHYKNYKVQGFTVTGNHINMNVDVIYSIKNNGLFSIKLESASYHIFFDNSRLTSKAATDHPIDLPPGREKELILKASLSSNDIIDSKTLLKIVSDITFRGKVVFLLQGNFLFGTGIINVPLSNSKDLAFKPLGTFNFY